MSIKYYGFGIIFLEAEDQVYTRKVGAYWRSKCRRLHVSHCSALAAMAHPLNNGWGKRRSLG
jgi:hypothetical protein